MSTHPHMRTCMHTHTHTRVTMLTSACSACVNSFVDFIGERINVEQTTQQTWHDCQLSFIPCFCFERRYTSCGSMKHLKICQYKVWEVWCMLGVRFLIFFLFCFISELYFTFQVQIDVDWLIEWMYSTVISVLLNVHNRLMIEYL